MSLRVLVVPAETHPSDHSFLEEVHTRDPQGIERYFLMRSPAVEATEDGAWNEARVRVLPFRPRALPLAWLAVYFADLRYLPAMWTLSRQWRPDVVYVRDLTFPLVIALLLRPWKHWRVVYQRSFPHDLRWFDPETVRAHRVPWLYRWARTMEVALLDFCLGRVDAVIPISEAMAREMVSAGTCSADRIHPFGMGVTKVAAEVGPPPERRSGDPLRLIYVGTLAPRRRIERLIEAIGIARREHGIDATLTVLGGTESEVDRMRKVVRTQGLEGVVDIPGRVPRRQVYHEMGEHHAGAVFIAREKRFLVASTTKLLESLAVGLPCVATDAVAMHEDLARTTGAIVVTDDSASGFARGIVELEQRWSDLAARARAGRQDVLDRYAYDRLRARMDRLLGELSP